MTFNEFRHLDWLDFDEYNIFLELNSYALSKLLKRNYNDFDSDDSEQIRKLSIENGWIIIRIGTTPFLHVLASGLSVNEFLDCEVLEFGFKKFEYPTLILRF